MKKELLKLSASDLREIVSCTQEMVWARENLKKLDSATNVVASIGTNAGEVKVTHNHPGYVTMQDSVGPFTTAAIVELAKAQFYAIEAAAARKLAALGVEYTLNADVD